MRVAGRRPRRATGIAFGILTLSVALFARPTPSVGAARTDVRIAIEAPQSLDPAAQSDIASAAVAAQLFESLTTFDQNLVLRPALAASWEISADARQVVFHLRPNLTFSDGSPLTAADVVRSWLRVIDPGAPSPLATLMLDVQGATEHLSGFPGSADPSKVGLHANGQDLTVDLVRPAADFPSIVASPTFAIVPPPSACAGGPVLGQCGVSSGGYTLSAALATELTLAANPHYWSGTPAIATIHLVTDLGGRSPVEVFSADEVDLTPIAGNDASWIRFDATLGPQLRTIPSLSTTYLGFNTTTTPFNDPSMRLAIGEAVDWTRIVQLAAFGDDTPATSMVPPGIPGRDDRSWLPKHDPEEARALLAKAGYPGGDGFPEITLSADGYGSGIAADLKRELGITVRLENYDNYFTRLATDPPALWVLGWVADYPGQNDFLGVLLGTGASSNDGRWSSAEFDAAIAKALESQDAAGAGAAFDAALGIVQTEVPAIPLVYPGPGWSLSRDGLQGAGVNALGIPRYAGLRWAQ